jgi:predicted CopG family antitoxin
MDPMTRKSVTLSLEAYEALRSIKRPGESFSDLVVRITSPKGKLSEHLDEIGPDEELASLVERTHEELNAIRPRPVLRELLEKEPKVISGKEVARERRALSRRLEGEEEE